MHIIPIQNNSNEIKIEKTNVSRTVTRPEKAYFILFIEVHNFIIHQILII